MAKLGVPFIQTYAKITNQEPLYTFDSLRTLREVNKKISHEKASVELGYRSRSLEQTIRDTIDWYKSNGFLH
jgi:dihydroflavonol-4-reductase